MARNARLTKLLLIISALLLISTVAVCTPVLLRVVNFVQDLSIGLGTPPPTSPEALLLDTSDLPEGWSRGYSSVQEEYNRLAELFDSAYDAESVDFLHQNSSDFERQGVYNRAGADHIIARFGTLQRAQRGYAQQVRYWSAYYDNLWIQPPDWTYTSSADEYHFGCIREEGLQGEIERCKIIARYGQYLSEFWLLTNLTDTSYEELEQIMRAIDDNFDEITENN